MVLAFALGVLGTLVHSDLNRGRSFQALDSLEWLARMLDAGIARGHWACDRVTMAKT